VLSRRSVNLNISPTERVEGETFFAQKKFPKHIKTPTTRDERMNLILLASLKSLPLVAFYLLPKS
jgi:hypothetical protein